MRDNELTEALQEIAEDHHPVDGGTTVALLKFSLNEAGAMHNVPYVASCKTYPPGALQPMPDDAVLRSTIFGEQVQFTLNDSRLLRRLDADSARRAVVALRFSCGATAIRTVDMN